MTEGENIYTRVAATSFNRAVATSMGDENQIKSAEAAFNKQVKLAGKIGADPVSINRADLEGRLKAAEEQGDQEAANFYRQSLKDL